MSGLFVELWLPSPVTMAQRQVIDRLIRTIGREVNTRHETWTECRRRVADKQPPVDKLLNRNLSAELRQALVDLKNVPRSPEDIANFGWSFQFADSSPFDGAPSADNYKSVYEQIEYFPLFHVSIENEPFRLITGWGTSEYGDESDIIRQIEHLEAIIAQLGVIPHAKALVGSISHLNLLAGHLSHRLIDLLGGWVVPHLRTVDTPQHLDELYHQVQAGQFPGTIYRSVSTMDTVRGPEEYPWHVFDAEFLREWLKHPTFSLV